MKPITEGEMAEAIATAKGPLEIVGGDTRKIGRAVAGQRLEVSGLSGITLYEPGALTLVAQAGTPVAEIEALLAAENQRLAFEPIDYRRLQGTSGEPTIGGVVATNSSGPRRIQAGACRDSLIGVRFVDGSGNVLKNGGRVMKNVTGYDLVKLLSGSYGTLGVLTEVSFKVQPAPEASATVVVDGLSDTDAVAALAAALGSPFDVNGTAHDPGAGLTAVRVEGLAGSVEYRAAELVKKLSGRVADFDWAAVRDLHGFADKKGDVWRFSVKPSDGPILGERLRQKGAELLYDWGGGLIWACVPSGDMRVVLDGIDGFGSLVRGSDEAKVALSVFHPEPSGIALLNKGLRAKFDPYGILNVGRMG